MNIETDLGREVRQNVARILKRFEGCDIAAVKVADLKKIDQLINPAPEGFEINTRNDRPYQTEVALKQVARVAAADQSSGFGEVLATIENHRAAGLREAPEMRGAQS